jgi:hypothetical protein
MFPTSYTMAITVSKCSGNERATTAFAKPALARVSIIFLHGWGRSPSHC